MKTKYIIITLIIVLVILFFVQKKEHAGSTQALSNEAIQNIAKVYADTTGTAAFNNLTANGANIKNTTVTGNVRFMGSGDDTWFPFTDGRNYIGGPTIIKGDADFRNTTSFKGAGTDRQTHFPFSDGKNYIRGSTRVDGNTTFTDAVNFKGNGTDTWFPFTDGKNYIRGETNMDGYLKINKGFQANSPSGEFRLVLQDDANLVIYRNTDNRVFWASQ